MNLQDARNQIRGTVAETVLINAHQAGGACFKTDYGKGVSDERSAIDAAQRLRNMGLAVKDHSMAGVFRLTADGHALAESISQSRSNGPDRWDAVQRALLRFVAEEQPDRAFSLLDTPRGVVDGCPISEAEAKMALEFLTQNGLLKTIPAWGAPDLRPDVTVNGMYAIHEPSIRGYVDRGFVSNSYDYSTNTTVNGGNVGAVTGGTGNTTTVHQSISPEARTEVLALADRILSEVPDDDEHKALRDEVESIRDEAASGTAKPDSLLAKAGRAALIAAATEGGQQVIHLFAQLGQAIGS